MAVSVEYQIKMLTLEDERCPFEDWFKSIKDSGTRVRIHARISRLQSGTLGDWKSVGSGVNELRIDVGPGFRVYFATSGETILILLTGGDKSTQRGDVEQARRLWKEYKNVPERFQRDFRI